MASASGFWGDTPLSTKQLLASNSHIDYIIYDYLAEVTMALLAKARMSKPESGFVPDFNQVVIRAHAQQIKERGIKLVANAGGMNPVACAEEIRRSLKEIGVDLKVACVYGDEVTHGQLGDFATDKFWSANAYLGAREISVALEEGADIVITGRVVDSALCLAPLVHELGWSWEDFDKLSAGSLAGHLIECGTQCTGGNFTDWDQVPGRDNVGFPIAEINRKGEITIEKPEGTGGLVSFGTVSEQLVYEIGDPKNYLLPDVICDWSQASVKEVGENRVKVVGARGKAPLTSYKVAAIGQEGYYLKTLFMLAGMQAGRKASVTAESILARVEKELQSRKEEGLDDTSVEILGSEATYGAQSRGAQSREVMVKIAATSKNKAALELLAHEVAPAATSLAPGLCALVGGRPKVQPRLKFYAQFISKERLKPIVEMADKKIEVEPLLFEAQAGLKEDDEAYFNLPEVSETEEMVTVPLWQLAWGRSGDKGNNVNIGVVARNSKYIDFIKKGLSHERVSEYMQHIFDHPKASILCAWELPGIHAVNFLFKESLGGGGSTSLRMDGQGKALAQQLLEIDIEVPKSFLDEIKSLGRE